MNLSSEHVRRQRQHLHLFMEVHLYNNMKHLLQYLVWCLAICTLLPGNIDVWDRTNKEMFKQLVPFMIVRFKKKQTYPGKNPPTGLHMNMNWKGHQG